MMALIEFEKPKNKSKVCWQNIFYTKPKIGNFDMKSIKKILVSKKGATAVEYAIIAALIAVVAVAGFRLVGNDINTGMANVANNI